MDRNFIDRDVPPGQHLVEVQSPGRVITNQNQITIVIHEEIRQSVR
jgi:hypothetical protein